MEVSALTGENVEELFLTIGELEISEVFSIRSGLNFDRFLPPSSGLQCKKFFIACAVNLCTFVVNLN